MDVPVQPTKCAPAGAAAAVTVISVPLSSPLAVPLITVNPAIDPENGVAANAIATKSKLRVLFMIIAYRANRLLPSIPQTGNLGVPLSLASNCRVGEWRGGDGCLDA